MVNIHGWSQNFLGLSAHSGGYWWVVAYCHLTTMADDLHSSSSKDNSKYIAEFSIVLVLRLCLAVLRSYGWGGFIIGISPIIPLLPSIMTSFHHIVPPNDLRTTWRNQCDSLTLSFCKPLQLPKSMVVDFFGVADLVICGDNDFQHEISSIYRSCSAAFSNPYQTKCPIPFGGGRKW